MQELDVMLDPAASGAEDLESAIDAFIDESAGAFADLKGKWEIVSESSAGSTEVLAGHPQVGIARFSVVELDNGWFVESVQSCSF